MSYTRNGYTWFDLPQVYEARIRKPFQAKPCRKQSDSSFSAPRQVLLHELLARRTGTLQPNLKSKARNEFNITSGQQRPAPWFAAIRRVSFEYFPLSCGLGPVIWGFAVLVDWTEGSMEEKHVEDAQNGIQRNIWTKCYLHTCRNRWGGTNIWKRTDLKQQ